MKTKLGETCLTLAVEAGLSENVRTLLEFGASPCSTNSKDESPLLLGNEWDSPRPSRIVLLTNLTKMNLFDHCTVMMKSGLAVIERLECLVFLGIVNIFTGQGCFFSCHLSHLSSALAAVRSGCYEIARVLLTYGAPVNQACGKRWTAMHEAAMRGHSDIMMLLLRWERQVMPKDQHGVTPLGTAAANGQEEIMQILIQNGELLCFFFGRLVLACCMG